MTPGRYILQQRIARACDLVQSTDLPLLEAVRTPVVVNPDPRLARVARRRGWRVERW